jgi:hypothetical protein
MCCATPVMLRRTSRLTGAPVGALIWVGAGGLLTMLLFIKEPLATRAVAISLAYGADLIIVAYILVVIAAIILHHPAAHVSHYDRDSPDRFGPSWATSSRRPLPRSQPLPSTGTRWRPLSRWSSGLACHSPTRRCGAASKTRLCSKPVPVRCWVASAVAIAPAHRT